MKVAWFTPYSIKSSIGRRSAEIVTELAKFVSVDLWHPEIEDERAATVPRVRFRFAADVEAATLRAYDLVVYNIGNHLPFHGEILRIAERIPGLIVLHDFVMHHFYAEYYLEDLRQPAAYVAVMQQLYGERGRSMAADTVAGRCKGIWETDEVIDFPMFEKVIHGCYGVVTHSDFLATKVRRISTSPVHTIPLCYELPRDMKGIKPEDLDIPSDRPLILTVGHVNPNKRVHSVLRALGSLGDLGRNVTYVVLGPCEPRYQAELMTLARSHGLAESVRFLGYADDNALHSYLQRADLCVNLRFPAYEGASGSVIEELWYGKPVIVTDTGFYSELSDDAVRKIAPAREDDELPVALRELLTDPERRSRLGRKGRELAQARFHPQHYVQEFLKFAWQVRAAKPALLLADRLAEELASFGITSAMPFGEAIAREAHKLFFEE